MLLSDVFVLLILCLLAWLWWLDRGFKQAAYKKCKQYCEQTNVTLLDDNIYIKKIGLRKNTNGQWKLYRCFRFEFTSTYEQRYQGTMETLGHNVINIKLDPHRI
ncbi:MAG: DUF3301 domain-containing protein [Gammaproteobacteria bacterium]|nr:DUF3301 domain-containing protein [Gammaproteobacteria bacterium]